MESMLSCLEEISTARVEVFYRDQMISLVANVDMRVEEFIKMITGSSCAKVFDIKFSDEWSLSHHKTLRSEGVKPNEKLYLFDEPKG